MLLPFLVMKFGMILMICTSNFTRARFFSLSALGDSQVSENTNEIIANTTSFEDSKVAQRLFVGSLLVSGQYQEAFARN